MYNPKIVLFSEITQYILVISTGITMIYGFRIVNSKSPLKLVVWLIITSFFCDFIAKFSYEVLDYYVYYVGETYRFIEFYLVLFIYYRVLDLSLQKVAKVILLLCPAILVIIVSPDNFRLILSITGCVLSIAYLGNMVRKMNVEDPLKHDFFWINAGFLLYFSAIVFLFSMTTPMRKINADAFIASYACHNIMCTVKNLLIMIGFNRFYKFNRANKYGIVGE